MPARITLDAYRGQHFAGHVRRIAPYVLAIEKQARTVEVEVEFERPGEARRLLVGYSADVEIIVEGRDGVLRIPTRALLPGNRVLRLGADDRLRITSYNVCYTKLLRSRSGARTRQTSSRRC